MAQRDADVMEKQDSSTAHVAPIHGILYSVQVIPWILHRSHCNRNLRIQGEWDLE